MQHRKLVVSLYFFRASSAAIVLATGLLFLVAVLETSVQAESASILVGTFDDLPYKPGYSIPGEVPDGYLGLNWNQLGYFEAATRNPKAGYLLATVSGPHVAFNSFENPVTITSQDARDRFTFVGAYFGAAWNDGLNISVQGFSNNALLYSRTVVANTTGSIWRQFDFSDIDKLVIRSTGGTPAFETRSFTHFAMDNFTIVRKTVPEPTSLALVCLGSLCLMRRR